ncbi:unnamed protein product [Haemonchus placei]|uniref:Elf-1_N domain-containing protein n=1 Tax=Haemonchus placei TaxID=6290 RepID=A0A0N4W2Q9_HAEPC|nr:unnamed protein product [Haemonchus placei]
MWRGVGTLSVLCMANNCDTNTPEVSKAEEPGKMTNESLVSLEVECAREDPNVTPTVLVKEDDLEVFQMLLEAPLQADMSDSFDDDETTVLSRDVCTSLEVSMVSFLWDVACRAHKLQSSDLDISSIEGDGGRVMRRFRGFPAREGLEEEPNEVSSIQAQEDGVMN